MTGCLVPSCDRDDVRPYLRGDLCPDHAPHSPPPPPFTPTLKPRRQAAPTHTTRTRTTGWDDRQDSTWIDKL